ncbi:MAG: hypothetical protein AAB884_00050 [Patescibacteria group bacterium]
MRFALKPWLWPLYSGIILLLSYVNPIPVTLVAAISIAACNPNILVEGKLPFCPTSDSGFTQRDSVSSGCCPSDSAIASGKVPYSAFCQIDKIGNRSVIYAFLNINVGFRPENIVIYLEDLSRDPSGQMHYRVKSEGYRWFLISEIQKKRQK